MKSSSREDEHVAGCFINLRSFSCRRGDGLVWQRCNVRSARSLQKMIRFGVRGGGADVLWCAAVVLDQTGGQEIALTCQEAGWRGQEVIAFHGGKPDVVEVTGPKCWTVDKLIWNAVNMNCIICFTYNYYLTVLDRLCNLCVCGIAIHRYR